MTPTHKKMIQDIICLLAIFTFGYLLLSFGGALGLN